MSLISLFNQCQKRLIHHLNKRDEKLSFFIGVDAEQGAISGDFGDRNVCRSIESVLAGSVKPPKAFPVPSPFCRWIYPVLQSGRRLARLPLYFFKKLDLRAPINGPFKSRNQFFAASSTTSPANSSKLVQSSTISVNHGLKGNSERSAMKFSRVALISCPPDFTDVAHEATT